MSLDTNIQQNKGLLKLSVTKHMKTSTKTTHSYTLLAGNAKSSKKIASTSMESTTYKTMELQWHKDSSFDSFANIFMTYIQTTTLSKTVFRTTVWKCYIHDIFSPYIWDMSKPDIETFIEQANVHHINVESGQELKEYLLTIDA